MPALTGELKREIGQHFIFGFHGHEVNENVKTLIRDYHVGNIILMKRNVRDAEQVRNIVHELQSFAKSCGHERPLMIGTDQENGLVSAFSSPTAGTTFPGAMAMAAAAQSLDPLEATQMIQKVAEASGKELKSVGINWAFAPVADINSEMNNPVIGVRSFGDDAAKVSVCTSAYAAGLSASAVAPCAKHFPGHGDTSLDSHLALPQIHKSLSQMMDTELVPFKDLAGGRLSKQPIESIMTGHMALPKLEAELGSSETSEGPIPASLSHNITTKLLRSQLKFEGLIVTDCLEMDAIADPTKGGCGIEEGAFRSIRAGADIVMVCHTFSSHVGSVKRVWDAVENEEINVNDLHASSRRVETLKDKFAGSWMEVLPGKTDFEPSWLPRWKQLKAENHGLSDDVYCKSLSLVSDLAKVLPLASTGNIHLYTPRMESLNKAVDDAEGVLRDGRGNIRNTAGASYLKLAESVSKRTKVEHFVYNPDDQLQTPSRNKPFGIIFTLRNAHTAPWQIKQLRQVLTFSQGVPVVILSSCLPYDFLGPEGGSDMRKEAAHIATFEYSPEALETACRLIFGEPSGRGAGKAPVLNGNI